MAKILVVDDERMICEEFQDILLDEGHEAEIAMSGEEALSKVEEGKYDIIFLDVLMPRMEGREVFDQIKKMASVPVVIMSGYLPAKKEQDVLNMGAFACLRKPLELEKVKSLIQAAVSRTSS